MIHSLEELRSGKLRGIKELKISQKLEKFPPEIFTLSESLELLDLSDNLLSEIPDLSPLQELKIAFFSNNRLVCVPASLKNCRKLFMLGLKANQIQEFDEDILPLSISWLILTDNKLEKLPHSIGKLTKMRKFPLAGNRLLSLPSSMQNLKELELIRLSANNLEAIPQWLLKLPKLAWLAFSGNPCAKSKESKAKILAYNDLEMDKLLGEGASGKIYRGHSKTFDCVVAIKLFKGAITSDGYARDEMNAYLSVGEHPNLIKVLARLEHKHLGLVLEYIASKFVNLGNPPNFATCTRDTFENKSHFTMESLLKIAQAISSASAHLHSRRVMHGDLYAHNILIDDAYNTYLGDFGAASFYPAKDALSYERVEVLAFGNLLEDMLSLVDAKAGFLFEQVDTLRKACSNAICEERPLFKEIVACLNSY